MLDIFDIKATSDSFFGMESEIETQKEPGKYGSEYAFLHYLSPTGKLISSLTLCRNHSNKGEWYWMGSFHTPERINLETMPGFGGRTKAEVRAMIAENDREYLRLHPIAEKD